MKFTVKLASVGNPDYSQDPSRPLYGAQRNHSRECDSLKQASEICRKFISDNNLGSGYWAGGVISENGKIIAHVSSNGRIWEGSRSSRNLNAKELCAS
jgi:hypothetical protein